MFMTDILMSAYDYVDELRLDNDYQRLLVVNKIINEQPTKLYQRFVNEKKKYEEVMEYGYHHPDFKETSASFSKIKNELYETDLIKEYLMLSKLIENKVTKLCNQMAQAISENIPIQNELGIFGIGGSCSGCK